jgi:5'-nucleotidase / UDP-sugar diphosphatase
MKKRARLLTVLFCTFLFIPALGLSQTVSLTILHTNDTHGHLLPFSYPAKTEQGSAISALPVKSNIGGIARRATLAQRLRKELSQNGTVVWLVDAGDFTEGTPFSTEYHGEADVKAMNAAHYDFATLGNHEFNTPLATLKNLLTMFQFPVLCANVTENFTGQPLTKVSEIRDLPPLKIGIFGLVTREAAEYRAGKEGVTFSDEIKTAQEVVQKLRPSVDIIIAISHIGEEEDEKMAAAVPGIDVIVGGHSHSRLPSGDFIWHSDRLKPKEVNGTIIVQAHQWAAELGRLDLLFEKDDAGAWHVDRYRARLIPITPDIPEDPEVAAVVERYWKPIAARYGEVIGEAAGDFIVRGDDLAPYNLFADSIREMFKTEIEFENLGGIRADLVSGRITKENLVNMDPFVNSVVTFRISGKQMKELLLKQRPAVSGIQYRIENGKLVQATVAGKPIQDNRIYKGATNSYFAAYAMKDMQVVDTGKNRLESVIAVIRKKGVVKPAYDGRRVIVD